MKMDLISFTDMNNTFMLQVVKMLLLFLQLFFIERVPSRHDVQIFDYFIAQIERPKQDQI